MHKHVAGLFDSVSQVNSFLTELEAEGFGKEDISLVTREDVVAKEVKVGDYEGDTLGDAIADAATTGGVAGGILGLLIGLGALTIPGVGALFFAGPIVSALGITGLIGVTASGALSGALAGGLVGALVELGFGEEEAKTYETRIKEGATMVGVHLADDDEADDVMEMMDEHGATDIVEFEVEG